MKLVNKAKSNITPTVPVVGDHHQSNVEIDIQKSKLGDIARTKFQAVTREDFSTDDLDAVGLGTIIGIFGGGIGTGVLVGSVTGIVPLALFAIAAGAFAGPFIVCYGVPLLIAGIINSVNYPIHVLTHDRDFAQKQSLLLDLVRQPKLITDHLGQTKEYLAEAVLKQYKPQQILNLSPEIRSEILNQPWVKPYLNSWFDTVRNTHDDVINRADKIKILFDIVMKSDDRSLKLTTAHNAILLYGYTKKTETMLEILLGNQPLNKQEFDHLKSAIEFNATNGKKKAKDHLKPTEALYRDHYQAEQVTAVATKDIEIIEPSRALSTAEQIEQVRANLMSEETARQAVDNAIQSGNSLSLIDLGDDLFKAVTRVLSSINQDSVATLNSARVSMADLMRIPAEAKARQVQLERMLDDSFIGKLRNKFTPKSLAAVNENQADFTEIDARLAQAQATARNFIEKNEVLGKYGAELISPLQHLQQAIRERLSSKGAKDLTKKQYDLLEGTCSHTEQLINLANSQIGLTAILDNGETQFYQFLRQLSLTNATAGLREAISVNEQKEKMRETLSASMVEITREDIRALQEKVTALETAFNRRSTELDEGNQQLKELGREIKALERPPAQPVEIEIPIMRELARG